MSPARTTLVLISLTALAACKSAPESTHSDEPSYPSARDEAADYPANGPPLRACPDQPSTNGELCRLTPVGERAIRIRVRFLDSTHIDSREPIPADLVRFRFLSRLEGFVSCLIPAARDGWTGTADTAIKATLVGATFEHVTMAPDGLPEGATACFSELTRRLRVMRPPGADARITQPVVVLLDAFEL